MGSVALEGFGGGGGAFAGLKIVGNPRPNNPTEETVWVNTDNEITGYVLSATAAENPTAGMLWIKISDSSTNEIGTALGKDYIIIMMNSASQYVDGAWVSVEAMSFQNGVWVDFPVYLYNQGDERTSITNGWTSKRPSGYFTSTGKLTIGDKSLKATATSGQYIAVVTKAKIDLSKFNTLCFNVLSTNANEDDMLYGFLAVFDDTFKDSQAIAEIPSANIKTGLNFIDISAINTKHYVGFGCASESDTSIIEVGEVYLK